MTWDMVSEIAKNRAIGQTGQADRQAKDADRQAQSMAMLKESARGEASSGLAVGLLQGEASARGEGGTNL